MPLARFSFSEPKVVVPWLGSNVLKHRMINMAVGETTIDNTLKNYDVYQDLYKKFSPYNHVDANDPPLLMTYNGDVQIPSRDAGDGIHHPMLGMKLKDKSDSVGHECHLLIPNVSTSDKSLEEFLVTKLLGDRQK